MDRKFMIKRKSSSLLSETIGIMNAPNYLLTFKNKTLIKSSYNPYLKNIKKPLRITNLSPVPSITLPYHTNK
jgi:hypothetical protein